MQSFTCKECNESKLAEKFFKNKLTKSGHDSKCKACRSRRQKARLASDPIAREMANRSHRAYSKGAKGRAAEAKRVERLKRAYIAEHGVPLCECGCGEPAKFDNRGRPRKYLLSHMGRVDEIKEKRRITWEDRWVVDAEKFRSAVQKIRKERNMTVADVALVAGIAPQYMNSIMYAKSKKKISKDTAEHILRRLAGMATSPTGWEIRLRDKEMSGFFS